MERDWIKQSYAQEIEQSELTKLSQYHPSDSSRAMIFGVRVYDSPLPGKTETFYAAYKFEHITQEEPLTGKLPSKLLVSPVQFTLESLPSVEKRDFYHLLSGYIQSDSPFTQPFNVEIDVISGDGRVIKVWQYGQCKPVFYKTYLQDSIFYFQFHGKMEPEIREKSGFTCSYYNLEAGEIDQKYQLPYGINGE